MVPEIADQPWPPNVERGLVVFKRDSLTVWTGKSDGAHVGVSVLEPDANETLAAGFVEAARRIDGQPGALTVTSIDDAGRWVVHSPVLGALVDSPGLRWKLARKLELFTALCDCVGNLHDAHGALTPWAVALDDSMAPVLVSTAGNAMWAAGDGYAYLAPELMLGGAPTRKADIYSLGRILTFLLLGSHPSPETEPVPRLDFLSGSPAGLARIIRRCTIANPSLRYDTVAELLSDLRSYGDFESVGLALANALELNTTGMSTPPEKRVTRTVVVDRRPAAPSPVAKTTKKTPTTVLALLSVLLVAIFGVTFGEDAVHAITMARARRSFGLEDPRERVQGLQRLIAHGEIDFTKANLSRLDLDGAELTGGNFRGASFTDATALGANMADTNVIETTNLETVTCDAATRMPQGWACTNGHFANAEK